MILDQSHEAVSLSEASEKVLLAIAENLGFIVGSEEAAAISSILEAALAKGPEALNEAKGAMRTGRTRLESLVSHSSLVLAQQERDPLFARYAQASEVRAKLRQAIESKYRGKAGVTARRLLANAGHHNMVDVSHSSIHTAA
jgi:iron only hydrogenase large subunit-like protein